MSEHHGPRRFSRTPRWLVEAAQRGDRDAQHQLLRRYEPLVHRVVRELKSPPHVTHEDLAQEARIGLLAAIDAWRPERGPFPPFAHRCTSNQALLAIQAGFTRKHELLNSALPLESTYSFPGEARADWPALTLVDTLASPPDAHTDPECRLLVREQLHRLLHALPALTECERIALAGSIDGQPYGHLGPVLGRTPKGASQIVYRARRKLARALPRAEPRRGPPAAS